MGAETSCCSAADGYAVALAVPDERQLKKVFKQVRCYRYTVSPCPAVWSSSSTAGRVVVQSACCLDSSRPA